MISLRSYIGTPHTIENIITVARPTIDAAANVLLKSNLSCPLVGVTLDCVYGESKVELVRDSLETKNYIIGGATSASELVGAALREADIEGRTSLSGAEVATQLMTVVLQDFDGKRQLLVTVLPVHGETGELIKNVVLRIREYLFDRGLYLIFGGGDGAKANLEGFRLVELASNGDDNTILSKVKSASEIPFYWDSDMLEHNLKHMFNQAKGSELLFSGDSIRLDRTLGELCGYSDAEGSKEEVVFTSAGDHSRSTCKGTPLLEIFEGDEAKTQSFHEQYSKIVIPSVLDGKDQMATDPAGRCFCFVVQGQAFALT